MRISEIRFHGKNKVGLVVEIHDPARYTTHTIPELPRCLFELFPHLARHQCHNGQNRSFAEEALETEVPHLLEHLIIELQSQISDGGTISGETEWNWRKDPRGMFHVHLDYQDEYVVLGAIRLAERIMSAIDEEAIALLDVEREVARLRELARLGAALRNSPLRREVPDAQRPGWKQVHSRGRRRSERTRVRRTARLAR